MVEMGKNQCLAGILRILLSGECLSLDKMSAFTETFLEIAEI